MPEFSITAQNPITVNLSDGTSSSSVSTVSLTGGATTAGVSASLGRGLDGKGWTGVTYDTNTGRFTFTSNGGLGYISDDITVDLDAAVVAAEAAQAGAEAAEAATEALFDQFGDQYLGPKASDPTVDNDGDPLTEGDIYFNTTDSVLKFYSGTAWVAPESIATTAAQAAQAAQAAAETAEANAATSENNAATSENNAATSEANAATSEANAGNSASSATSSASAAAGSASAASASETSAASSATSSASSASSAATSATNASSSAAASATSETNAATSASASASSASSAATSATNAAADASSAATSATNASNSETSAASSAASAAISETNAAASAASLNPNNIDINGGTIDGTVIGGTTPAAITGTVITGTSFTSSGNISVTGTVDGRDVSVDGAKLDGIEAGATADQTAAQILTAIKTVDGAGSGLDADLLDGQQGSYYAAASHVHDYVPERSRTDWNDSSVRYDVIGQLGWANYGNNHTIFDASASVTPTGVAKNNTNPDVAWTGTYPTLMGYNGSQTYGVRVDSARYADNLGGLPLTSGTRNNVANQVVRTQANGYAEFGWINTTSGATTTASSDYYVNTNDGYIRKKTLDNVRAEIVGGAGAGAVGSYALLTLGTVNNDITVGQTIAGSLLVYTGIIIYPTRTTYGYYPNAFGSPAGTWRAMGYNSGNPAASSGGFYQGTLFLRIS